MPSLEELTARVGDQEAGLRRSSDRALRERFARLRAADDIAIPFALVREAARRVLGLRPHDVQITAGLAMARGLLVEMQTGEGKTLAAVAPACLFALAGRGVHVLTFNDYLARRDAEWMGPVYGFLGLSAGFVQEGLSPEERRRAYAADVTYLTAKEAGFDYLRDGLVADPGARVQPAPHAAIVDEADSILIDEARLPLVLAGRCEDEAIDPAGIAAVVAGLEPGEDYETDAPGRNVSLTESGLRSVERRLGRHDLYESSGALLLTEVQNALHARALVRRDVDYIVRDGKIELVDELTGRVVLDRLWPDGLQAAVEAREGQLPRPEGRILASVTLQHYVKRYPVLTGMTATARSAAAELKAFYGLEVATIPTHRACIRIDHPDVVLADRPAKLAAVVQEIVECRSAGRPVLVGTASVAESEQLAATLRARGVECSVLNAKNDAAEAAVVARAGRFAAVTISTNMAGRGTDIRLGGPDGDGGDRVAALGGLHVIGTQRHESRRIDDQLRGRAARQGDPGSSRFFVSLEDDLIRRFGDGALIARALNKAAPGGALDHPWVRKEVAWAQRVAEGQNFETRKTLHDYSSFVERQRRFMDRWRRAALDRRDGPGLFQRESPRRYEELAHAIGPELLRDTEREITLRIIDRSWSDHLARIAEIRQGIHLVRAAGRAPLDDFQRHVGEAFERMVRGIEEEIVATLETAHATGDGVALEQDLPSVPSSTWTYIINDDPFKPNPMGSMARSPALAAGIVMLWPLLIMWGLWVRFRQRHR